jgi:hypothetical protein
MPAGLVCAVSVFTDDRHRGHSIVLPDADPCAILTSLRKPFFFVTHCLGRINSLEVSGTRASIE